MEDLDRPKGKQRALQVCEAVLDRHTGLMKEGRDWFHSVPPVFFWQVPSVSLQVGSPVSVLGLCLLTHNEFRRTDYLCLECVGFFFFLP